MTTHRYDARGLRCPLPVLRARKLLGDMAPGAELEIVADDPMAAIDLPVFAREAGHALVESREDGDGATLYRLRRGAG
ncbi:sulfurtransferase TusA family protein [Wenxinia saemankumensis]|uniref:tRNA 2-thiouridine synthesizing protein A n=1 Tax=Wenxinia saemankumensis TaxID=1447782 RepID=A0A1M6AVS1_9RHOB|nr:sulfurtransferase TusA family protein [Wenxinia saemankumensis]SHI40428.1 tRNA 2-thiouridine synthesizing protein A [Wenxinia saemankumensis]